MTETVIVRCEVRRAWCKNCGGRIWSVDGWVHSQTGDVLCPVQPAPKVAEPGDGRD